jgi:hypothetical protein
MLFVVMLTGPNTSVFVAKATLTLLLGDAPGDYL